MFTRYIAILEALAMSPAGATVGQVQKLNIQFTRGQIERTLKELIAEKFVRTEKVFYRRNINKTVYHINESAAEYCAFVVRRYYETEHQRTMFDMSESA